MRRGILFPICLAGCCFLLACGQKEEKGTLPGNSAEELTPTPEVDIASTETLVLPTASFVYEGISEAPSGQVAYEAAEFTDMIEIHGEEGKGIQTDLDGDGEQDYIYVSKGALYINDVKYAGIVADDYTYDEYEECRTWWLMDIVKDDGMLEMLFPDNTTSGYEMYHYSADTLVLIGGMREGYFERTICNPIFVDDKTISCMIFTRVLEQGWLDAYCSLDENGLFVIVPGDYAVDDVVLTATQEIKLYKEKDMAGAFTVAVPQEMTLTKTDGRHWTYLVAEDGTEGWVYTEYVDNKNIVNKEVQADECFEGFSTAG